MLFLTEYSHNLIYTMYSAKNTQNLKETLPREKIRVNRIFAASDIYRYCFQDIFVAFNSRLLLQL